MKTYDAKGKGKAQAWLDKIGKKSPSYREVSGGESSYELGERAEYDHQQRI